MQSIKEHLIEPIKEPNLQGVPRQQDRPRHRLRLSGADDQLQEEGPGGSQRWPEEMNGAGPTDTYR